VPVFPVIKNGFAGFSDIVRNAVDTTSLSISAK
jgi:hypothetical protein